MAADRQRVSRSASLHGAWGGGLRFGPAGAVAWFGDIDPVALPRIAPTPSDLADAGRRSGEPRRHFLARRSALRHLVAWWLDAEAERVVIGYDGQGAPRLLSPRADVFVSVAGRAAVSGLAVASRPVGIDVEPLDPEGRVPWAVLAPAEREYIKVVPEAERIAMFLRHWTAKEAYLKALGTGLLWDPAEVNVCWREGGGFAILDGGQPVAGQGAGFRCEIKDSVMVAAWFVEDAADEL